MKEYNRTHQIVVDYECLPCLTVPATVGLYMLQYYEKMMNLIQVILGRTDDSAELPPYDSLVATYGISL